MNSALSTNFAVCRFTMFVMRLVVADQIARLKFCQIANLLMVRSVVKFMKLGLRMGLSMHQVHSILFHVEFRFVLQKKTG
jgi:hypothetical protein